MGIEISLSITEANVSDLMVVRVRREATSEHPQRTVVVHLPFKGDSDLKDTPIDVAVLLSVVNDLRHEVGLESTTIESILPVLGDPTSGDIYFSSMEVETDSVLQPLAEFGIKSFPTVALMYGFHTRSETIVKREDDAEEFPRMTTSNGAILLVLLEGNAYFYSEDGHYGVTLDTDAKLSEGIYALRHNMLGQPSK